MDVASGSTGSRQDTSAQRLSPLPGGEGWGEGGRGCESLNQILNQLDFLVVQDMFTTVDTAQNADLFLPAAGWGEKEGTFINSERRIGLTKKVSRAPGEALSDFNIFRLVASYWGCGEMFAEWTSPEAAFQILKRLSAGQPCDITGIADYQHLDAEGGIQWPLRAESCPLQVEGCKFSSASVSENLQPSTFNLQPERERRLFAEGQFFHADGKARFLFDPPRPVAEPTDAEFPFVMLTGRGTSAQWHTNTRTGKSAVLRTLYPANPYLEINPADAARLGLTANAQVVVVSRRARMQCAAFVTASVQPGQIFVPMHYPEVNRLTKASFDPHSRQPSYKHCAVRVEKLSPTQP